MTRKQYPKLRNPKLKHPFSKVPDYRDILAITKGHNWKPVTRKGRFINANYPPKDATKEELEAIERFWGNPKDIPDDYVEKIRAIQSRRKKTS
jgi:hypothetical protein